MDLAVLAPRSPHEQSNRWADLWNVYENERERRWWYITCYISNVWLCMSKNKSKAEGEQQAKGDTEPSEPLADCCVLYAEGHGELF